MIALAVVGGLVSAPANGARREELPSGCPGYVAHLQSARACLARGDRRAAAAELRQAERALDSCMHGAAGSDAVAQVSPSPRAT